MVEEFRKRKERRPDPVEPPPVIQLDVDDNDENDGEEGTSGKAADKSGGPAPDEPKK